MSTTMAPAPTQTRWGDDPDSSDEDEPQLLPESSSTLTTPPPSSSLYSASSSNDGKAGLAVPPTHTSRIDSKGIKVVTSYRVDPTNSQRLLKTTSKIKVSYETIKEHRDVEKRRQWKKFGLAAVEGENVTIPSRDDVFIENPHADIDLQDEDPAKAISGNLSEFWARQHKRSLQRKYEVDGDDKKQDADAAEGWTQVGPSGTGTAGDAGVVADKYIPPSARGTSGETGGKSLSDFVAGSGAGKSSYSENREQNTIRVTNISEDTNEEDLQELFKQFGRISRIYLAKDKGTLVSRGFAFVSFVHREDAEVAMKMLQGHGYDHLILKLEWARPSAPKDPATSGTEYRSGYGKALAQDTKDKVSYASNLTMGH